MFFSLGENDIIEFAFIKNTLAAMLRINERGARLVQGDEFCMQCPPLFSLGHYPAYVLRFLLSKALSNIPCPLADSVASSFVYFVYTIIVLFAVCIAVI